MLVLGVTADDKGAQLEALVRSVLESQGCQRVRRNLVGSGGNELDVVAERKSEVVGAIQGQTLSEPPWGIEPQTYALRVVSVASAE